jgi:hypothetical protein
MLRMESKRAQPFCERSLYFEVNNCLAYFIMMSVEGLLYLEPIEMSFYRDRCFKFRARFIIVFSSIQQ